MRLVGLFLVVCTTAALADPLPDRASGVVQPDEAPTSDAWLWLPRGLLFIPRVVLVVVAQPVRGIAYVSEKYDVLARIEDLTFTDDRRFGAYPIAGYESTYGFSVGARIVARDVFLKGERLRLGADYGGEFRYALSGRLTTGRRLGPIELALDSAYERRGRERFYGIGDSSEIEPDEVTMPLDPNGDTAVESRFTEDLFRVGLQVKAVLGAGFTSRLSATYADRSFDTSDKTPIEDFYDTSMIPGYTSGVENVYVEEELAYDTRRPASEYSPPLMDGAGWYIAAHVGGARGVGDDPTSYLRYGGEIQRPIDLYDGTRILTLRVLVDAIAGDDISFVELPRLGGTELLRGYPTGRFRDRAVSLATAEYEWQLSNHFNAYVFFDIGGPLEKLSEVVPDRARYGYGLGVEIHSAHTFFTRAQFSLSREHDVFFDLVFSPSFGRRTRGGRF